MESGASKFLGLRVMKGYAVLVKTMFPKTRAQRIFTALNEDIRAIKYVFKV